MSVDYFKVYSCFYGLKLTINKCEIAALGFLKETQQRVCGLQSIVLIIGTIKTLGIYFSCNKIVQTERSYLTLVKNSKGSRCMNYKDIYSSRKNFDF